MAGDFSVGEFVGVVVDEDGALFEDTVEGIVVTLGEPDEILGAVITVISCKRQSFASKTKIMQAY